MIPTWPSKKNKFGMDYLFMDYGYMLTGPK